MDDWLHVTVERTPTPALVRLVGTLSLRTSACAAAALLKVLRDAGSAVVDLSGLRSSWDSGVLVFPTVLEECGGWPEARLALFGAGPGLARALRRSRVAEFVPLAAGREEAETRLARRPDIVRVHSVLPAAPTTPAQARALLRRVVAAWGLEEHICRTAVLVLDELISNAVEHASTSMRVTATLWRASLHVSVRDFVAAFEPWDGTLPVLVPGLPVSRGRGLALVAELAEGWGVTQHADGKTVWAVLPADSAVDNVVLLRHP